jgi:para-nitrobenzyl esterase
VSARWLLPVFATLITACAPPAPTVTAGGEQLTGERSDNGVLVFRGIPFAEPPVGNLRWQKPRPHSVPLAERDATAFAPACMQSPRILEWYRGVAERFGASRDVFADLEISEDCLYLNVWTPDTEPSQQLPVLVYVHGGSNSSGWSYEPNYHGQALANRDAVVVSIAYRLGVFGFFSHPELDNANYGLWDQVLALEWVRDNIAAFGGDPGRVMLFGESAGAQDVLALMASDLAKPLFHSAALQSTAGYGIGRRSSPTLAEEQARGARTAAGFGFDGPGALAQLRALPADELLRRYGELSDGYYHSPAVDGELLKKPIWDVITDGELSAIPFIIGSNADERYAATPEDLTFDDVPGWVEEKRFLNSDEALAEIRTELDPREAIDRLDSAESMLCPSQSLAAMQTALNGNAWFYYFTRVRDGDAGAMMRAYHGIELPYVFGTHDPWMTTSDRDRSLSREMMQYWVNLATTGDPNGGDLPHWPPFPGPAGEAMIFGDDTVTGPPPEPVLCGLFEDRLRTDN